MDDHDRRRRLSEHQAKRKEQLLTQADPSKVKESAEAIVLKQRGIFLLTDADGDVPDPPHGLGLYYHDCRHLDGYALTLNGSALTVLSSDDSRGHTTSHQLTNPELSSPDGDETIAKNTISIGRERTVHGEVLYELLRLRNYGASPAVLRLELRFASRFEDLFILKGFVSGPRGEVLPAEQGASWVRLRYLGADDRRRSTLLSFSPQPSRLDGDHAVFDLRLEPRQPLDLTISIEPAEGKRASRAVRPEPRGVTSASLQHWLERSEQIWLDSTTDVRGSDPLFSRVFRRALLDLRMLRSSQQGLHYFAAGVPWFVTLFGRDAATVSIQTLPYAHVTPRETLALLARHQAGEIDHYRDAEPGKILHEFRSGELARIGEIPQSPAYYGTVDATLLFVILLGEYVDWSGDLDLARSLRSNLNRALEWMDRDADHDGDGYLDYLGEFENGLINQGWKDSGNAIVNADGTMATPPIALCEVQAYAYRAWRQAAALYSRLGDEKRASALDGRAEDLKRRFARDFWSEDLGCYILARQKNGRPCEVVSSNAGQVLWGGIASPEHAARVAERLLRPDMFSGWGIRTLSSGEQRFNPMSYHLGSVWPHDNALILAGLKHYGHDAEALRIFDAIFDAAAGFRDYRLPELFSGFERSSGERRPVGYPVACRPQAWAAGALPHALWNLLGLRASAPDRRLYLVRPCLPVWLRSLELTGLRVGDAEVDLRFEQRTEGKKEVDVRTTVKRGELTVERVEEIKGDQAALPRELSQGKA